MVNVMSKCTNDVVASINDDVRNMYFADEVVGGRSGRVTLKPHVCCSCDRLLVGSEVNYISVDNLKKHGGVLCNRRENIDADLVADYTYCGRGKKPFMKKLLMSPRSCYVKRGRYGVCSNSFVCCRSCSGSILNDSVPKFSICNYMLGCTPDVLSCLSDIELAYISPVRFFGHLFASFGGSSTKMKGFHTFMKVDVEQVYNHTHLIADIISGNNISVVLSGPFTKQQKEATKKRYSIRLDRVKAALNWLRVHNCHYSGITEYDVDNMPEPVLNITDSSVVANSDDSNIESLESFRVVFPDGYLNEKSGGSNKISDFKSLVRELEKDGHDLSVFSRSLNDVVPDYTGNFITAAFPKVYPYGVGGPDDVCFYNDGSANEKGHDLEHYIKHVSMLSHNAIQESHFSLVMFNIHAKQSMVRNAGWVSRRNIELTSAISELNGEDVVDAVSTQNYQSNPSSSAANHLLSSVSLISRYLPHGKGAASQARGNILSMCHTYGDLSYFMTINPDEENNVVLQVFSGEDIDLTSVDDLSKVSIDKLRDKAVLREKLSCKYPGYGSHYFDQVVDIVVKRIIGWDVNNGCAFADGGYFGVPEAYMGSVEEQGRARLHIHFGIWIKAIKNIRDVVFSGKPNNDVLQYVGRSGNGRQSMSDVEVVETCKTFLCREVDRVSSVNVLSPSNSRIFKHKCDSVDNGNVFSPIPCSDQRLRNMRHEEGCGIEDGNIVSCPKCPKSFNTNDIGLRCLEDFNKRLPREKRLFKSWCFTDRKYEPSFDTTTSAKRNIHIEDAINYIIILASRDYLYNKSSDLDVSSLVNFLKNIHSSHHAKSCWKRGCECRYRFPKQVCLVTHFVEDNEACSWYLEDGQCESRFILTINLQRSMYDVFSNTHIVAVSKSVLACNSNISLVVPGPICIYITKYLTKDTQKDDVGDFDYMLDRLQSRLLKKKKVTDYSEGMSRIISATFTHNTQNVIGAPLAKYLTKHGTRFHYSHKFVYVPAEDIYNVLCGDGVRMRVHRSVSGTRFLTNSAYDYLYRPVCFENLDPVAFYCMYEVILKRNSTKRETFEFSSDSHPGFKYQVVAKRAETRLPKFRAYSFPDTKDLNGNIYDPCYEVTQVSEEYSRLILLHFLSYRILNDLSIDGVHTKLLRLAREQKSVNPNTFDYLENMQNQRNHCRIVGVKDSLERSTEQYVGSGTTKKNSSMQDEEEDNQEFADFISAFYEHMDGESQLDELDNNDGLPECLLTAPLLKKGLRKGLRRSFSHDDADIDLCDNRIPDFVADLPKELTSVVSSTDFIHCDDVEPVIPMTHVTDDVADCGGAVTRFSLVSLAGRRCRRRVESRLESDVSNDETVANGSAESIIKWSESRMTDERGRVCRLDEGQRAAFQCMTSAFILTYYRDADKGYDINCIDDSDFDHLHGEEYERNRRDLVVLANKLEGQLIMFLSGPGGSGKSECIRQTIKYCSGFCRSLSVPFSKFTIRVTALTGVAAVAINGETIDTAAKINKNTKNLNDSDYEEWKECRLLIVDEVSFMGTDKLVALNNVLIKLRELQSAFGGLNIVFCGDFRQLEPIIRGALSKNTTLFSAEGRGKALFYDAVNCYVELTGLHRFDNDVEWGKILYRLRNGEPTDDDIIKINERVIRRLRQQSINIPDNSRYATYRNKNRDRINMQLFLKRVKDTAVNDVAAEDNIMIFCDDICTKETKGVNKGDKVYKDFNGKKDFWTYVSESDCTFGSFQSSRFDPVLKLWKFAEVMLTDNDVIHGNANGTQLNVISVKLKPGEKVRKVSVDGISVNAVLANQVEYVLCLDPRQNILKKIYPEKRTFKANFPVPKEHCSSRNASTDLLDVRSVQVPIISNSATTGYKLQGAGVENIVVTEFSRVKNWIYVLLSRVRTRDGLFLKDDVPSDLSLYAMCPRLKDMLSRFSENCSCTAKTSGDLFMQR